jgi:CheY-like chemotaxis protein
VRVRREVVTVPRILVADDNTNIQKMVVLAFEERGVDVVTVGNGEAAVRRIPDMNPDLVLADVFMPVRNGYEVCEFVKKDSRFAHVPVILLVGAFDPLDEKEARRVGADGVLKKPFVPPDPLIAMVMSALEKNPKIAAEMAKAREVPVAPPPPPVMEIPLKTEPKPLPDFPEPTPEEAAAIYGFGKGVRSLDDEAEEAQAKGPKAPVAKAEVEAEDEDDFDGAATATDWRRTGGMDFEIPDNVAVDPGYSYGSDTAPITFPSEKDVPPKRVRVPDDEEGDQSLATPKHHIEVAPEDVVGAKAQQREAEPDGSQSFAPYGMKISTEESASEDAPAAWHQSEAFQLATSQAEPFGDEHSAPAAEASTRKAEETPAEKRAESNIEQRAAESVPAVATSDATASSSAWTDSMSSAPSEYPEGGWMTDSAAALSSHASEPEPTHEPEPVAAVPSEPSEMPEPALDLAPAQWSSARPLETAPPPAQSWQTESAPVADVAPASAASTESKWHSSAEPVREERPKKKSWFADAIDAVREVVQGGSNDANAQPVGETYRAPAAEPIENTALVAMPSAPAVQASSYHFAEESGADHLAAENSQVENSQGEPASQVNAEFETAAEEARPSRKDPELEAPVAAHVTPEPLLVRDDAPATSQYGASFEASEPMQSFPLPNFDEPVNGQAAASTTPAHEEVPVFVAAAEQSEPDAFGDRIPTAPPPNREALAGIPFLMPTPAALEAVHSTRERESNDSSANIDEMVQKVLERLEPQLHELLSKNLLKPLVENILQQEMTKNK